jgi:hypothetical protein
MDLFSMRLPTATCYILSITSKYSRVDNSYASSVVFLSTVYLKRILRK